MLYFTGGGQFCAIKFHYDNFFYKILVSTTKNGDLWPSWPFFRNGIYGDFRAPCQNSTLWAYVQFQAFFSILTGL